MKKILIILVLAGVSLGVSAQKFYPRPYYTKPHVIVTTGFYPSFYPYGFYGPYYPYPYGFYPMRETRLERKIEDIRSDYKDKIWSARHDKTLSRQARKTTIHELKHERDQAIASAKSNYYKTKA
jgi:hypothetical protein